MTIAWFIDTNVLTYAYDVQAPDKQTRAIAVLDRLAATRRGCLSAQVLGEFFVVATRMLAHPLSLEECEQRVTNLARVWTVYDVSALAVQEAIRGVGRYRFAYWNALIWSVAKLNGVPNILTEDLPGSQLVEGVRFLDPFADTFALEVI